MKRARTYEAGYPQAGERHMAGKHKSRKGYNSKFTFTTPLAEDQKPEVGKQYFVEYLGKNEFAVQTIVPGSSPSNHR